MGIISYGIHIPFHRLSNATLAQVWVDRSPKGEKAVANADEDSLTMAVEAGMACIKGIDRASIDALYFASTTPPFREKQSASLIAAALDLREDIITADFTDSVRCGTIALKTALDLAKGSGSNVLVLIADCRVPAPNSAFEPLWGDGAVAFLVGREGGIAELEGSQFFASEFVDIWRLEYDRLPRTWEDRFIREEGYLKFLPQVVSALLKKMDLTASGLAKAAFTAINPRDHVAVSKMLGLDPKTQVQDSMFDKVGNTGGAFAPMLLAAMLEEARQGDKLLVANYGDGADALLFRVNEAIKSFNGRGTLKKQIDSKLVLDSYGKYIKFKGLMEFEQTPEMRPRSLVAQTWRDRKWIYRFHGHKCANCGHVQFPMQRFCMYCRADEKSLSEVRLAEKRGELVTFSLDERAPVINPPSVLASVNIEGGGRFYGSLTDADTNKLSIGMPTEFAFRRFHDALGFRNYFWKAKPVR